MAVNKYDMVETHIDYLRRIIKEVSDDSYFTDEELYMTLINARALIYERRIEKGKALPSFMYQTICIPLCEDVFHDCKCVPTKYDCKVLKTKVELPDAFFNGTAELLRVSTLSGEEVDAETEATARYRQYKKTRLKGLYYIRTNKKLAIFNSPYNRLRVIRVRAVFYDPVTAMNISLCDPETKDCVDPRETGFGTLASDNMDMYNMALSMLRVAIESPDDRINDAESTVPQAKI